MHDRAEHPASAQAEFHFSTHTSQAAFSASLMSFVGKVKGFSASRAIMVLDFLCAASVTALGLIIFLSSSFIYFYVQLKPCQISNFPIFIN
jgi:hypothetical protein